MRGVAPEPQQAEDRGSGHWLIDEAPAQVIPKLLGFFQA